MNDHAEPGGLTTGAMGLALSILGSLALVSHRMFFLDAEGAFLVAIIIGLTGLIVSVWGAAKGSGRAAGLAGIILIVATAALHDVGLYHGH